MDDPVFGRWSGPIGTAAILCDLRQIVKKLDILIGDQDRHPAEKEEFTRKGDI